MAIDKNPMSLAEFADCLGPKTTGDVDLPEATIIKQKQDIAYMAGIAGVIQHLNPSHRLSGRAHRGSVNQRPVLIALAQGVELATAERPEIVYQTGAVIVLKGAARFSAFFLLLFVACYPAEEVGPRRARHGLNVLPDNPSLQGSNINITHESAAKRATQAANRVMPIFTDLVFEASVNSVKFLFQFNEVHGPNEDTKIVMEIKSVIDFCYRQ
jgi:hypothetical protein